jgi:hypothetical protein
MVSPGGRVAVIAATAGSLAVVGWWGFESAAAEDVSRWNTAVITAVFAAFVTVAAFGAWRRPTDPRPIRLAVAAVLLSLSYFRFLHPPWLASVGALAWLASPAFVLATFTEPARDDSRTRLARWNVAFATIALLTVAVSGPRTSGDPMDARRAISWAWYDDGLDQMVRQPNPLAVTSSPMATAVLTLAWWLLLIGCGVSISRVTTHRTWRSCAWCSILATIVLSLPQRLGGRPGLLDPEYGDVIVAIPLVCAGVFAAWVVWSELITPRLIRPEILAVQLDASSSVDATRRRLRRVLGDPSATIVFPSPHGWINEAGHPHGDRPGRRLVTVTHSGVLVAGLELDATTPIASDLLADAACSLAVSLEAQRLAAHAAASASEARETATRLIEVDRAAIDEIGHEIEIGPVHTLGRIDLLLERRPLPLDRIHDELRRSLEQVRAIAHRAGPRPQEVP